MPIYTQGGKLIRVGGTLKGCCCDGAAVPCCCSEAQGKNLTGSFGSDGACGSYLDGRTITLTPDATQINTAVCVGWRASVIPVPKCEDAIIPFQVKIRCNTTLEDRGGGAGLCDKMEANIAYLGSPCNDTSGTWHRVEAGCSCSPLLLVFTLPTPSNSGLGGTGCGCCANPTVTLTVTL